MMLTGVEKLQTTTILAFLEQATTSVKRAPVKEQRLKMIDGFAVLNLQATSNATKSSKVTHNCAKRSVVDRRCLRDNKNEKAGVSHHS